jgi:hypothetical protein
MTNICVKCVNRFMEKPRHYWNYYRPGFDGLIYGVTPVSCGQNTVSLKENYQKKSKQKGDVTDRATGGQCHRLVFRGFSDIDTRGTATVVPVTKKTH